MKMKMTVLTLGSVLLLGFGWVYAQSTQHEAHHGMQAGQQQSQMMQQCQMMQEEQHQMMSQMKTTNQELEALVQKMNASEGNAAKLEAMQEILAKMVENRAVMQQHMMEMMPRMMGHMSKHMQRAMESGEDSMMECPMMSGQPHDSEIEGHDHSAGSGRH